MDGVHALVDEAIEEHGPFDGALGFIQGAAVLASYLLQRTAEYPEEPLPFQFAIFCSTTIPCAANSDYSRALLGSLTTEDERRVRSAQDDEIAQLPETASLIMSSLANVLDATEVITTNPRPFFLDRHVSTLPCVLHPNLFSERLSIPTLHVRAKNDLPGLLECGLLVESFCDSRKRQTVQHTAGHDIPRSLPEARRILLGMEWVVAQSQVMTL